LLIPKAHQHLPSLVNNVELKTIAEAAGTAHLCSTPHYWPLNIIPGKAGGSPIHLVRIYSTEKKPSGGYRSFSYPNSAEVREGNSAFIDVAASTMSMVGVSEGDLTRRTFADLVSANYSAIFGTRLPVGRAFLPQEKKPDSAIPAVIAIRISLGAGRFRLIRQLLTEGFVLAVLGGAGGLLLAVWASQLLVNSLSPRVPFVSLVFDPRPDWRILAMTFTVCVLSVLIFGLGPAWKLSRLNVTTFLKEQAGDELHGRTRRGLFSLRSLLIVGQLALSLVLLTAAGLFARGAVKAARANPGFSFDRLVLVETDASLASYDEAKGKQGYSQLIERLRALPGVESGALTYVVPFGLFSDGCSVEKIAAPTGTNAAAADKVFASFNIVDADCFKTLGLPLLRGRNFDAVEVAADASSHVAIIDEPLAK
jgi:hypothetical protein